jgi:FixJ family two-component response regulator
MSAVGEVPLVCIVDDDVGFATALARVLILHGWAVTAFESAEAFLGAWDPSQLCCLVLDVHMPGLDGMALQRALIEAHETLLPIVFLTGHGDLPSCVEAIKSGASDFLAKPVAAETLIAALNRAIQREQAARVQRAGARELRHKHDSLTTRERQVLAGVAAGRLNKQIAAELGITEQTVKFHRARLMDRMNARTASDLMRMAAKLAIGDIQ